MLFYIDYLDHITSGTYAFNLLAQRLRFDLLVFCGNDTLCMSVPACVKIGDTTKLLMALDPFWKEKKFYFSLTKSIMGKQLIILIIGRKSSQKECRKRN